MTTTRYTSSHEWVRLEEGGIATVGISSYAQDQLGDVVFVELPTVGRRFAKGDEAAVVESVKAASEVYAPVGGEVVAVNEAIAGEPGLVNRAPEGEGWFIKLRLTNPNEANALMDAASYASFLKKM